MKAMMKAAMKKAMMLVLALAAVFSVMMFTPKTAEAAVDYSGRYMIQTALGDRVLDIAGASKKNGANLQIYKANASTAQQFDVIKSGKYYRIQNVKSGLVLDVQGGKKANKTNVRQWKWNGSKAQLWTFVSAGNGQFYIKNVGTGKVLDVAGGKNNNKANVWQYKQNKSKAQKWNLISVGIVLSVDSAKYDKNGNIVAECYLVNNTPYTVTKVYYNWIELYDAKENVIAEAGGYRWNGSIPPWGYTRVSLTIKAKVKNAKLTEGINTWTDYIYWNN